MQESNKPLRIDPGLDTDLDELTIFFLETWGEESSERLESELAQTLRLIQAWPEESAFFNSFCRRRYFPKIPVYVVYVARETETLAIVASHSKADPNAIERTVQRRLARDAENLAEDQDEPEPA